MTCDKEHRYLPSFSNLQDSQDNQHQGRHKCAGCAYVKGLRDALNGYPSNPNLINIPDSQAGTVRHKDAMEAYILGYNYGITINS